MTPRPNTLVVMRLVDMHRVHPAQDNTRVCSDCGAPVGIFPSGQEAMRRFPDLQIICNVCINKMPGSIVNIPAPGALEEIGQSVPTRRA
jgi:hypothetical protein